MKLSFDLFDLVSIGKDIWMIVITGGPCSGKTSGIAAIVRFLSERGYKVLVVPETATKFIMGGILPGELGSAFQDEILIDILTQEQRFIASAMHYRKQGRKVVILCDRGTMDGKAYMRPAEFRSLLKRHDTTEREICNQRYHAVMHLRTAADGAEEYYTLKNNAARSESPDLARKLDQATLDAWQRHPHPRVIDNSTGFKQKMKRLLAEICGVLGDPVPLEIEDKFLIRRPDLSRIPVPYCESMIIQDYLMSPKKGEERRVRARGDREGYTYFYTVKEAVSPGVREEREEIISEAEYRTLLTLRDPAMRTIKKKRITFFWKEQYFEVDIFTSPRRNLFLMEAERTDRSGRLILPPFITMIRNVTGEKEFSNKYIARIAS